MQRYTLFTNPPRKPGKNLMKNAKKRPKLTQVKPKRPKTPILGRTGGKKGRKERKRSRTPEKRKKGKREGKTLTRAFFIRIILIILREKRKGIPEFQP